MDELNKNLPDDFWRKAFDEAAETPPPRVWNTIERRLDEGDETKIVPLWGVGLLASKPFAWGTGMAAAVALLLLGRWVFFSSQPANPVAEVNVSAQAGHTATVTNKSLKTKKIESAARATASGNSPRRAIDQAGHLAQLSATKHTEKLAQEITPLKLPDDSPKLAVSAMRQMVTSTLGLYDRQRFDIQPPSGEKIVISSILITDPIGSESDQLQPLTVETLAGKPLRLRSLGPIQRIVWFRPAEPTMEPEKAKSIRKPHEKWASVSAMPGAFDPLVSIRSAQPAGLSNTVSALSGATTAQQSVKSQANFSVAYQASAGVQLTDRWSVESGVGYLAGRSTVESPALATAAFNAANRTSTTGNLYADAVRASLHSGGSVTKAANDIIASPALGNYSIQASYDGRNQQVLTNNYQYIQVPVQVGYQLRPRKRLSLAVLGGILTNIFVRNTVGNELVVTNRDGIYRPVSLGATVGARLRYRPSRQWSASLAGIYQPSLGFGTQPDSQVQTRPTSAGMSVGVDYHF